MRLVLAAIAVTTLITGAKAQVGVEEFKQLCMDHHGERAVVLAAADKSGWMPVPQALLEKFPTGTLKNLDARMLSSKEAMLLLLVGEGKPSGIPQDLEICGIAAIPSPSGGFSQAAADISGVEKFGDSTTGMYVWRDENGKHHHLDMSDIPAALKAGDLNLLMTRQSEKMAMIMLALPADQSRTPPH